MHLEVILLEQVRLITSHYIDILLASVCRAYICSLAVKDHGAYSHINIHILSTYFVCQLLYRILISCLVQSSYTAIMCSTTFLTSLKHILTLLLELVKTEMQTSISSSIFDDVNHSYISDNVSQYSLQYDSFYDKTRPTLMK